MFGILYIFFICYTEGVLLLEVQTMRHVTTCKLWKMLAINLNTKKYFKALYQKLFSIN